MAVTPAVVLGAQIAGVTAITVSQALINHRGIRLTTRLTDFSGYWILIVAAALTGAMLFFAKHLSPGHLLTFTNYSGERGGGVWPATGSVPWLFLLSFLLPAYTVTGFDASAHTAEETIGASVNVPRGIARSVLVSGVAGWIMLAAVVAAIPDPGAAAKKGSDAFAFIVGEVVPGPVALALYAGIAAAQYLCGLATVTSASRMAYAFARDGGLPFSSALRKVSPAHRTPVAAIWTTSLLSIAFTVYTPVYTTITAVCTIFLYLSYVIPTVLGLVAWGRTWTAMGPWGLGRWYRPVALVAVLFCLLLVVIGVQPPNDKALWIVAGSVGVLGAGWLGRERRRFAGPPGPSRLSASPR
jgi:amino acid transporter